MEFNKTCPKNHNMRQVDEETSDTVLAIVFECDDKILSHRTFNLHCVGKDVIAKWGSDTMIQHQLEFLLEECARLAGIIDKLENDLWERDNG